MVRNNHLIEDMRYVGEWYNGNIHGRVKTHRYLVEKNHSLFDDHFFIEIEGWFYLKPGIEVHHIDFNHNNNELHNLQPLTKGEHVRLHNLHRNQSRDSKSGRFIKSK